MNISLMPLHNDSMIRVRCEGNLSLRGAPTGTDPLETLLGPRYCDQKILVNLDRAQGIDTSGISWLMKVRQRFDHGSGCMVLYAMPPVVSQALDFVRLTPLLRAVETEAAAVALASATRETTR